MTLTAGIFNKAAADHGQEKQRESQATALVRLVTDGGADLWHTPNGDPYISVTVSNHREHYPLNSRATKDYLSRAAFTETGRAPNAAALQDALNTLSGIARFDGDVHQVHVRLAGDDRAVYLDLCDAHWRVVEITPDGWRITSNPPVRFRRAKGMLPLPVPEPGGSITELRRFVNVAHDDDFILVVAWVLAALRPRGPYPILVVNAEQGGAKTTTTRVQRRLVDPNESDVRRPARNTEDLMIAATNGHVVAFDNLSRLPDDLSDNLAVLSTGGGFAVRQLFTNAEEQIFNATKPIILNGISQVATRGDLLDRAIVITLPTIPEHRRQDESTFWLAFGRAHPHILGALLDAIAVGLQRLPTVLLQRKPRMADFALWAVATEPACPWLEGMFLRAYERNRHGAVDDLLEGDPVVDLVRTICPWTGTATALLQLANDTLPDIVTRRKDWFTKPRQIADALRRLAPALRGRGIDVTFPRVGKDRTRTIRIEEVGLDASASSASSAAADPLSRRADVEADGRSTACADSSAKNSNICGSADAADAPAAREPSSADSAATGSGGGTNGRF